jgi:succinylglutamate desuccinylase
MEQRKLSEQKQLEAKELRRSQEEARQKEAEKSRIQYDLMDAIPACRQANTSAKVLSHCPCTSPSLTHTLFPHSTYIMLTLPSISGTLCMLYSHHSFIM